jgi:hypothetical protein
MLVPVRPERAHLQFVVVGRVFLAHAFRNVVPLRLGGVAKAALALLERLDVIRRRKAAGPEEFEEVEQPVFSRPLGLFLGGQAQALIFMKSGAAG